MNTKSLLLNLQDLYFFNGLNLLDKKGKVSSAAFLILKVT